MTKLKFHDLDVVDVVAEMVVQMLSHDGLGDDDRKRIFFVVGNVFCLNCGRRESTYICQCQDGDA